MTGQPCAARPSTVDETLVAISRHGRPLEVERIPLGQARGRVLREPVIADVDQPPFDRSAMDGYAVRVDDPAQSYRIVDRIRAGEWKPRELKPGEAIQIATGGALPGEGLRVVMKEEVRVEGTSLVLEGAGDERHIRFRGEDVKAGQVVVQAGTVLGPGPLGLLASVGCVEPAVTRLPRVLHVATGNEIVPPGQQPGPGQIRDSNSILVRAFLEPFGIETRQVRVAEDRAAILAALQESHSGRTDVDLLLVSGGASVGEHDFTRGVLEELGFAIHIHRTTTRPGKPLIFGSREHVLAFGLPGNPLAHFVCLNLYLRQALWRLSGAAGAPAFLEGQLAEAFPWEPNDRETLWPARVELVRGEVQLVLLPWQSSGDLTALGAANALVRVPPSAGALSRGARVFFLPT